jgi:integrase
MTARRLRNAGITVARLGSHTLRHSCAQRLAVIVKECVAFSKLHFL